MTSAPATTKIPPHIQAARNHLRRKGWSQREAAEHFGVTDTHLCYVLNARRTSARLIREIMTLPENPNPA